MIYFALFFAFVSGAAIGSFLNVCIIRLPREKSVIWPGSHCGQCLKPIRGGDNIPLLSYWLLGGRCRSCGATFSSRYFVVELLTALGFTVLMYLIVVEDVHGLGPAGPEVSAVQLTFFLHHALLFSLLMVVAWIDLDAREIPLGVTIFGTAVGLVLAVCFPWPWPRAPAPPVLIAPAIAWWLPPLFQNPLLGLYPWPIWWPLPDCLAPGGDWQTGLATGVTGMVVGSFFVRAVRFVFTQGLGKEAIGLGDADLMMMAGSFLGWQPVVIAFFIAVVPALLFGVVQLVLASDEHIPFGPALALGVLTACLFWDSIAPGLMALLFNGPLLGLLVIVGGLLMLASSLMIRLTRWLRGV